jgi:hypothetical protein
MQGNTASFVLATDKAVKSVTLDPDHKLPEADRTDDVATMSAAAP